MSYFGVQVQTCSLHSGLSRFGVSVVKMPLPVLESFEQVLHPALPRVCGSEPILTPLGSLGTILVGDGVPQYLSGFMMFHRLLHVSRSVP